MNNRCPEEDKKKGHEKILEEIIAENFPKMGKEIATQVQETQRVPNRINPRQNTPRHILIKLTKIKHKKQILKAAKERQQITQGIPIRITADLSIETSGQKGMGGHTSSDEREKPTTKMTVSNKDLIQM